MSAPSRVDFKNAIDWLVSRDEIIAKPIVIIHASHRGDDMLEQMRAVLATVSENFAPDIFERFALKSSTPAEVAAYFEAPAQSARLTAFLDRCAAHIGAVNPRPAAPSAP